MTSNNNSTGGEEIVSVTENGQVTIPDRLREKHGISVPGRVAFAENEDGELVVDRSARCASSGDSNGPGMTTDRRRRFFVSCELETSNVLAIRGTSRADRDELPPLFTC
ncbi:AbrB/MazE/SpoVT family DNA-binding domain-containing protein [Halostagnicola sp. A-GB9-2]|uniref:AbrB/MazE/SpoVT family DNA-binding domain-containing protein n=1 Tax=Halostagnicola sp. A-GB9-2 TaxID=3048066 RepID=UPI0024C022A4|nr:AbrB/MazE/SpoVT family DNA-binding domain-containing protein [Halostagnicola sp. A-GB9-2]MDJ1432660.1 AbrB/MazE/SpoVT family DNA-binding domain-containing protein [Halostagnicola sp. A-GB9-2]